MQSLATNKKERCCPAAQSLKCVPRSPGGGYIEFQVGDLVIVEIILGRSQPGQNGCEKRTIRESGEPMLFSMTSPAINVLFQLNKTATAAVTANALAIGIFMLTSQARDRTLLAVKARDTEPAGLLHRIRLHLDFPGLFMNRPLRFFGFPEQRQVLAHAGVG